MRLNFETLPAVGEQIRGASDEAKEAQSLSATGKARTHDPG